MSWVTILLLVFVLPPVLTKLAADLRNNGHVRNMNTPAPGTPRGKPAAKEPLPDAEDFDGPFVDGIVSGVALTELAEWFGGK